MNGNFDFPLNADSSLFIKKFFMNTFPVMITVRSQRSLNIKALTVPSQLSVKAEWETMFFNKYALTDYKHSTAHRSPLKAVYSSVN